MQLSPSNWILVGPGHLYGAPFVSGHLIYRFGDIDCSLLLHAEDAAISTTDTNVETGVVRTQVGGRRQDFAYLRASYSATTPLWELAQVPSVEIPLTEGPQEKKCLERLKVSLTLARLPSKQGFFILDKKVPPAAREIERTDYIVTMPGSLCSIPEFAKDPLDHEFLVSYEVSVLNEETGKFYNLDSDRDWTLTALGMVVEWRPIYEGILQRRAKRGIGSQASRARSG